MAAKAIAGIAMSPTVFPQSSEPNIDSRGVQRSVNPNGYTHHTLRQPLGDVGHHPVG
jgi:hypothetical protein